MHRMMEFSYLDHGIIEYQIWRGHEVQILANAQSRQDSPATSPTENCSVLGHPTLPWGDYVNG